MTGSSVFEYVHEADHAELTDQLGLCVTTTAASGGSITSSASFSEETTGNGAFR